MEPILEPSEQVRWYVMRAYKCQDYMETSLLSERGLNHFIPKKYIIRIRKGRKEKVLIPTIPGIFFVHANRKQIHTFKEYAPQLQYCYHRSHIGLEYPMVVPDREMESFMIIAKQIEEDIDYHNPDEIRLARGTKVRIHGGPFDGLEGTLVRVKGKRSKRVVVKIEGVVAISSAEISPDLIEVLQ